MLGPPVPVSTNGCVAIQAKANGLADGRYFRGETLPLLLQVSIPFFGWVPRRSKSTAGYAPR